jgi:hypothetical protein
VAFFEVRDRLSAADWRALVQHLEAAAALFRKAGSFDMKARVAGHPPVAVVLHLMPIEDPEPSGPRADTGGGRTGR